jgi:hypothetical protein
MNINQQASRPFNANQSEKTNQPTQARSMRPAMKKISVSAIQQKMSSQRRIAVGAKMVSVPVQYRLSGEGETTKITKLELLKRVNQHNEMNNYHNPNYEPIDFREMSHSSWDLFSAEELLEMRKALQVAEIDAVGVQSTDVLKETTVSAIEKHKINRP